MTSNAMCFTAHKPTHVRATMSVTPWSTQSSQRTITMVWQFWDLLHWCAVFNIRINKI